MVRRQRQAVLPGLLLGVVLSVAFTLLIRMLPLSVFTPVSHRVALFAVQVVAAPSYVWMADRLGRRLRQEGATVLSWAIVGTLAFDGLAISFAGQLYGRTGETLTWTAATVLWAVAWILVAAQVRLDHRQT